MRPLVPSGDFAEVLSAAAPAQKGAYRACVLHPVELGSTTGDQRPASVITTLDISAGDPDHEALLEVSESLAASPA